MDDATGRGIRAGIAAYVLWGLLTVYWKQLDGFAPFELIGWRVAMAAVVMVIVVSTRGRWAPVLDALRRPRLLARLAFAGALLTVNWTLYVHAVVSDQIIETALGYFLAPLGTMTIGVVVLGERLTPLRWAAVAAAVAAVIVLTVSYGSTPWIAIGIAASWSVYGLAKRRVPLSPVESLTGETLVLLLPALGVIAWSLTRAGDVVEQATPVEWVLVAGTGVVTAVPLLLFSIAARSVPFTVLGPLNYLVPLINFALGWAVYGEPVPAARFAGFVLVWLALVAITVESVGSARRTARGRAAALG